MIRGSISRSHVKGDLCDIVSGRARRENDKEITVFKSLGIAIEDIICAQYVYKEAEERNIGTIVPDFAKL